jgi:Tfp pilus assembly protein PilX/cytoskeletal protein CcmA (bactofilin family)
MEGKCTMNSSNALSPTPTRRHRRGSVYVLILATTTVIATVVAGSLHSQMLRGRSERLSYDASKARLAAMSGVDVARAWIAQEKDWRSKRTSGRWANDLKLGEASVDLDVVDTTDNSFSNHPYHGVTITATARVGEAEQIYSATLTARPVPIDSLGSALHTAGQLYLSSNATLRVGNATASTNGSLKNDGLVEGNVQARSVEVLGNVWGTCTTTSVSRSMPTPESIAQLIAMGTSIPSRSAIVDETFSPARNPYGQTNPYGIYVMTSPNDVRLSGVNVLGTLILLLPAGKKVELEGTNSFTPASVELPALMVRGDMLFKQPGTSVNGLLHVTNTLIVEKEALVRGAVIVESPATSDATKLDSLFTINYDAGLSSLPPVGYASRIDMVLQQGSFRRITK